MNPQFDHKFLEQYLAGKMSPVEKMAFEARLNGDNVLRAELEAMKRMRDKANKAKAEEPAPTPIDTITPVVEKTNYIPYLLIALLSFVALLYLTLVKM